MGRKRQETDYVEVKEEIKVETVAKEEVKKVEEKVIDERLEKRRQENKRRREVREKIKKDTEIIVMNNCSNGSFFYRCPVTKMPVEFDEFGQETDITFEMLDVMQRQKRGILEKYWIIPIDVNSDEVTIEEVLEVLGIQRLYTEDMFYSDNLDYILLDTKLDKFENMMEGINVKYAEMLAERAISLANQNRFSNISKMKILANKVGNKELFANIIELD